MSLRHVLLPILFAGLASAASAAVTAGFEIGAPSPCVSPCAVYVDAIGSASSPHTTDSASGVREFHDVEFRWTFGDSASGTWSTTGRSKNRARGPSAAHVYEISDGSGDTTFTITLDATAKDGSTDRTQKTIRVVDPASLATVCVSRTSDMTGCPSNAARVTGATGAWNDLVDREVASGRERILFRRSQTWGANGNVSVSGSGITVGAFGPSDEPRPRVDFSSRTGIVLSGHSNLRFRDLELAGNRELHSIMIDGRQASKDVLFLRIKAAPGTWHKGSSMSYVDGLHTRLFVVEADWVDFGFGSGGNIHYGRTRDLAVLGSRLGDATGGEHVLRMVHGEGAVLSNSEFFDESDRKAVLTIRSWDNQTTRDIVITENIVRGKGGEFFSFVSANKSTHTVHGSDFLVEGNLVTRTTSGSDHGLRTGIKCTDTDHVTIRNNMLQMDDWKDTRLGVRTSCNDVRAHANRCYSSTSGTRAICVDIQDGRSVRARDNILYAPNVSDPRVIRDVTDAAFTNGNQVAETNPFVATTPRTMEDFQLASEVDGGGGVALEAPFLH